MYDILFVDDDDTIGFLVKKYKVWKYSDFQLKDIAHNGKEALELLEKGFYDLVITDIRMPMIDGLELFQRIHKKGLKLPVILASTYSDFEYAKEGLILGAIDYIVKPFTEEKLKLALDRAEEYIQEQRKEQSNQIDVTAYISKEHLQKLYDNIVIQNQDPMLCAKDLLDELEPLFPHRSQRLIFMVRQVIIEIWNQICHRFPWISQLEQLNLDIAENNILSQIANIIEEIQRIIKNYGLRNQNHLINKACALLVNNMNHEKIMDFISEEMDLSKDYLGKLFRSKIGITMKEYCILIKMEYAKQLLKDSNLKIYEIGEKIGFRTTDYFSKLFKMQVGVTPMEYRKQNPIK